MVYRKIFHRCKGYVEGIKLPDSLTFIDIYEQIDIMYSQIKTFR